MIQGIEDDIDQEELDILCQVRRIKHQLKIRDDINSKVEEIVGDWIPPTDSLTRSYGVEQEGQAYDVWHHILERVTDPREIRNLWNVSRMFRNILRDKYIETMLPEVVNLVLGKFPNYVLPLSDQDEIIEGPDMELNVKIFSLVNIRLISKQCNKFLEDTYRSTNICPVYLKLDTVEMVETIRERLRKKASIVESSFLAFDVLIDDEEVGGDDDELDEFHEAITDLLGLVGPRIRCFEFHSSLDTSEEIYDCLRKWALFMPNLVDLSFALNNYDDDERDPPPLEEIGPFPQLPKLQSIREVVVGGGYLASPFIQRILEACRGIQKLLLNEEERVREHSPLVLETLSNLSCLRICPYRSLLLNRNLPWMLKKLILYREGYLTTVSSCQLFSFLKQFEETLEHLELQMVDVTFCCGYLHLRNLKTLSMELHESYDNLNFLLYAEKLETLEIRIGEEFMWNLSPEEKFSMVISGSFFGRSVWDVYPYLKRFQLRTAQYSERNGRVTGAKFEEFRKVA